MRTNLSSKFYVETNPASLEFARLNRFQGTVSMTLILAVILAFLLIGTAPVWPHSVHWGYYPSSGIGVLLAILVIYLILKRA